MRGMKVKTISMSGKEIDEFIVEGVHQESELLKRVILNIYSKMGDGELLLLRYVVIMDFKPTVLGVIDIGL